MFGVGTSGAAEDLPDDSEEIIIQCTVRCCAQKAVVISGGDRAYSVSVRKLVIKTREE